MRSSLNRRRLFANAFAAAGVTVAPNIRVAAAAPPLLALERRIGTSGMDLARNPAHCSGTQPPHAHERFLAKYVDEEHGPLLRRSGNFNIAPAFRYALTKHLFDGEDIICSDSSDGRGASVLRPPSHASLSESTSRQCVSVYRRPMAVTPFFSRASLSMTRAGRRHILNICAATDQH